jgi:hypothetical protein
MLTPEITGSMRVRLGGEVPGELFEPVGIEDESEKALTRDWDAPETEESAAIVLDYTNGAHDPRELGSWEVNDSTEGAEPEFSNFAQPEDPEIGPDEGFESPGWAEPQSADQEESRVITPARIVRTGLSSRVGGSETRDSAPASGWMEPPTDDGTENRTDDSVGLKQKSRVAHSSERMASKPEVEPVRYEHIVWKNPSQLVGFLVSYDNDPLGSFVELRKGRLLITSEGDVSGNCLIVNHDTVSPMHAIMRIVDGSSVQILDQLSEHGTHIVRGGTGQDAGETVLLSGDKASLRNGDILSFGDRKFHVCLVTAV